MKVNSFLALILGFLLGVISLYFVSLNFWGSKATTSSEILLKNIKKVCKLTTVEGNFTDILDHKEYSKFDFYPFQKKAILKVKAKVGAGYNLEALHFEINDVNKQIKVSQFPNAEILFVDMDVQYFDISEGIFNTFTEKELTELNTMAKDLITLKAYNSILLKDAEAKAFELLESLRLMTESFGWQLVFEREIAIESHPTENQ